MSDRKMIPLSVAQAAVNSVAESARQAMEHPGPLPSRVSYFDYVLGTGGHFYQTEGFERIGEERDEWKRLFNRLDAAISHHRKAKQEGAFCDDADDALHAAHDRILKAATRGPEPEGEASSPEVVGGREPASGETDPEVAA